MPIRPLLYTMAVPLMLPLLIACVPCGKSCKRRSNNKSNTPRLFDRGVLLYCCELFGCLGHKQNSQKKNAKGEF